MKTLLLFFAAALAASAYAGHSKPENTHLVTMRKAELMEIINCVSKCKYITFRQFLVKTTCILDLLI